MPSTGIQFIDGLRGEWSAGSITQGDALDRLLPWEDDAAARTQAELEAAWTLRQELETGAPVFNQPEHVADINVARPRNGTGVAHEPDAAVQRMVADLRANPLATRDDLLAANAICLHLTSTDAIETDRAISTLCIEVEDKVTRYIETTYSTIDRASSVLQDTTGMEEKLGACDTIREGLAEIGALRPGDSTLPDMLTWCEQTRQELTNLLAERGLVATDVAGLAASGVMDTGLVESSKQRLINLSDMQLSKDDIGFRKVARDLATFLTAYLSGKLQPGTTPDKETVNEYKRVLHLAKQAPEAIRAEEAKKYGERLIAAQAEIERDRPGSEPSTNVAAHHLPPPPQPRSTSGSQPETSSLQDGTPSQPSSAVATTPLPSSVPGYRSAMPAPPPPRVQPGWGTTSTQPAPPVSGYGTTGHGTHSTGTGAAGVPPNQNNTTTNLTPYSQPAPIYVPNQQRQGLPPAAWAGIAIGVGAVLILLIVIVAVLAGQGKPGINTNPGNGGGGGGGPRDATLAFYQDLQAHNYQAAFDLLGPPLSEQTDVNTLRGNVVILENREGNIQTIDVSNISETGDTAQSTVTVNYAKGNHSVDKVSMSKQATRWIITNLENQQ